MFFAQKPPYPAFLQLFIFVLLMVLAAPIHAQDISNADVDSLFNDLFTDAPETSADTSTSTSSTTSKRRSRNRKKSTGGESSATSVATDQGTSSTSNEDTVTSDTDTSTSPTPTQVLPPHSSIPGQSPQPGQPPAFLEPDSWDDENEPVEVIPQDEELVDVEGDGNEDLPVEEDVVVEEEFIDEIVGDTDTESVTDTQTATATDNLDITPQDNPLTTPPEEFTGTYSDEDDSNTDLKREADLFGSDEVEPDDEEFKQASKNFSIKLEYTVQAIFAEAISGDPYMEVNYISKFETEMIIAERRIRANTEMDYSVDVTGSLARTELFDCPLDITMEKTKVDLMTRLNKIENSQDGSSQSQLALQIKLNKKPNEIWSVKCEGMGGVLMTRGDKEEINFQALEIATPSLAGITLDDFNPYTVTSIDLTTESFLIDDQDTRDLITITGSGTITIEPSEANVENESDVTIVEEDKSSTSKSKKDKKKIFSEPTVEEILGEDATEDTSIE